jgi:hypothetical protein
VSSGKRYISNFPFQMSYRVRREIDSGRCFSLLCIHLQRIELKLGLYVRMFHFSGVISLPYMSVYCCSEIGQKGAWFSFWSVASFLFPLRVHALKYDLIVRIGLTIFNRFRNILTLHLGVRFRTSAFHPFVGHSSLVLYPALQIKLFDTE